MAGEELFAKYQTIIFLAGSASAEFFADMALAPFEAIKVGGCGWVCGWVWVGGGGWRNCRAGEGRMGKRQGQAEAWGWCSRRGRGPGRVRDRPDRCAFGWI
jgi:solute carrier family 25 phosphate transporter 3